MTTKLPNLSLPTIPPDITKDYILGVGEQITHEFPIGTGPEIESAYIAAKTDANNGYGNLAQVTLEGRAGRYRLIKKFARTGGGVSAGMPGQDVSTVEELYAVDVVKDILTAPYFQTITDEICSFIRMVNEQNWSNAAADLFVVAHAQEYPEGTYLYANWSNLMKDLRWQMAHGQESYYETGFELRRSKYGVKTSSIKVSFTDNNKVVAAPVFNSGMDKLVESLPVGEWLYKSPAVENLGHGKWRTNECWQWADRWSIIYGGSWTINVADNSPRKPEAAES